MLITWSDFGLDFFTNICEKIIKGVSNLFWVSDCFIIVYNTCWRLRIFAFVVYYAIDALPDIF